MFTAESNEVHNIMFVRKLFVKNIKLLNMNFRHTQDFFRGLCDAAPGGSTSARVLKTAVLIRITFFKTIFELFTDKISSLHQHSLLALHLSFVNQIYQILLASLIALRSDLYNYVCDTEEKEKKKPFPFFICDFNSSLNSQNSVYPTWT